MSIIHQTIHITFVMMITDRERLPYRNCSLEPNTGTNLTIMKCPQTNKIFFRLFYNIQSGGGEMKELNGIGEIESGDIMSQISLKSPLIRFMCSQDKLV